MLGGIIAVFVVLMIFALVASLFSFYVWRVDPYQFASWRAALRPKRDGAS